MKLDPKELNQRGAEIAEALNAAGMKVDVLTVNALALLVIQICVRARVSKKQFLQIIRDNWRHEVMLRDAREEDIKLAMARIKKILDRQKQRGGLRPREERLAGRKAAEQNFGVSIAVLKSQPMEVKTHEPGTEALFRTKPELMEGYWQARGLRADLLRALRGLGFSEEVLDTKLTWELRRLLEEQA